MDEVTKSPEEIAEWYSKSTAEAKMRADLAEQMARFVKHEYERYHFTTLLAQATATQEKSDSGEKENSAPIKNLRKVE